MCTPATGANDVLWVTRAASASGALLTDDLMTVWEGGIGSGPKGEWNLASHSSGQEPMVVGLDELDRLRREAGNADGAVDELFFMG